MIPTPTTAYLARVNAPEKSVDEVNPVEGHSLAQQHLKYFNKPVL